ncbi:hypothetical protein FDUTEX481_09980 [Tolypothrix sp. PCC 7601]|nr:hypothetical protein FDUTEX481_09980 [Tolypothrix sp. PCC 7601]
MTKIFSLDDKKIVISQIEQLVCHIVKSNKGYYQTIFSAKVFSQ